MDFRFFKRNRGFLEFFYRLFFLCFWEMQLVCLGCLFCEMGVLRFVCFFFGEGEGGRRSCGVFIIVCTFLRGKGWWQCWFLVYMLLVVQLILVNFYCLLFFIYIFLIYVGDIEIVRFGKDFCKFFIVVFVFLGFVEFCIFLFLGLRKCGQEEIF